MKRTLDATNKPCDIKDYQDKDLGKYEGTSFETPRELIINIFKDRVMDMYEDVDFLKDIKFVMGDNYIKHGVEITYKGSCIT